VDVVQLATSKVAIRFGDFLVDLRSGELRRHGTRVKLQVQPFQVLQVLLERPGEVVRREELQKRIWPADISVDFDHGLNNAVKKLREALGDDAEKPRFIETLSKRGYRFIGTIQNDAPAASPRDAAVVGPQTGTSAWEPSRKAFLWATALGLVVAAGLALGYFSWRQLHPPEQPTSGKITLAVLPFENLTGDPSQEYFSDGFTEEMITVLAGLQPEQLGVIARTSAMKYKHTDKAVDQIGRELGVQFVLEGSVRRDAGRTRISAQLIQVKDQTHVWADSYQRDMRDTLGIQNEVALAIAGHIRLRLTPPEQARLAAARPVMPEAHDAYLRGRFHWYNRTREGLTTALNYFQKAVSLDPSDPLGYVGIADSYIALAVFEHVPPSEAFPRAKEAVLKALALDDTLPDAHGTLAQIYQAERDWEGTERECKRALALNPNYAGGHYRYSLFLSRAMRHEEALAEAKRALELDPLSPSMRTTVGQALLYSRRYDQAEQELLKALELDPNFFSALLDLSDAYNAMGRFQESLAQLQKAARLSPGDLTVQGELGYVYARMGRTADAEKIRKELVAESQRRYVSGCYVAMLYIGLGRKDEAIGWLERAYEQKDYQLSWMSVSPVYDPIRSDPRFAALMRRADPPQ
jgi:TolB-like protein/DNA-binding winged helix-turn-helix (wHTH) protein/Tfp pilus assembly protein PilF